VNYANIYPGVHAFNDGLVVGTLHGADLSGLVSMLVAAGSYTIMLRLGWK
jgi:chromate transport protein ChrA